MKKMAGLSLISGELTETTFQHHDLIDISNLEHQQRVSRKAS